MKNNSKQIRMQKGMAMGLDADVGTISSKSAIVNKAKGGSIKNCMKSGGKTKMKGK